MQTAVPAELCYSMTDPRMPMFAKPLGVASDEMVADKVFILSVLLKVNILSNTGTAIPGSRHLEVIIVTKT